MNEVTFLTQFNTIEELMLSLVGVCLSTFVIGYLLCWLLRGASKDIIRLISTIINYFKRKKRKGKPLSHPLCEYKVEECEGCGVIFCNNEFLIVLNSYENALMVRDILVDDNLINIPFNR